MIPTVGSREPIVIYTKEAKLTQGTIFSCGVAEEYEQCQTYGIIITARCDAEHDKVQVYNYLPIVTLRDWLSVDGKTLLAQRLLAETMGGMRSALKENNASTEILKTEEPRRILETLFSGAEKKLEKLHKKFSKLCDQHELANRALQADPGRQMFLDVATTAPQLKDTLIRELVHQRLAGFYFFEQLEPHGNNAGYVALLREIRMIPKQVVHYMTDGIDVQRFSEICKLEPRAETSLRVGVDDFAMPIALLSSPYLEHMMQSLALLFGRIGLPDPDPTYIGSLWERQQGLLGSNL